MKLSPKGHPKEEEVEVLVANIDSQMIQIVHQLGPFTNRFIIIMMAKIKRQRIINTGLNKRAPMEWKI